MKVLLEVFFHSASSFGSDVMVGSDRKDLTLKPEVRANINYDI